MKPAMQILVLVTASCVVSAAGYSTATRQTSSRKQPQSRDLLTRPCDDVQLGDSSGRIFSILQCPRAPDDLSKYANKADWNFRITNRQGTTRYVNVIYSIDIEDSSDCESDSLAFGDSTDPERVVICGKRRAGQFSVPVGPLDVFTIRFKSDYSVGEGGFNISYALVGSGEAFSTTHVPRSLYNAKPTAPSPVFTGEDYMYPDYPDYQNNNYNYNYNYNYGNRRPSYTDTYYYQTDYYQNYPNYGGRSQQSPNNKWGDPRYPERTQPLDQKQYPESVRTYW